jgi:ferric enterobactin receptor
MPCLILITRFSSKMKNLQLTCLPFLPVFILFLFCFGAKQVSAQTASILGKLVDSSSTQVLAFATILLKDTAGNSLKGAASDQEGAFLIEKLAEGQFVLEIQALGYQSKALNIVLQAAEKLDLATISLPTASLDLQEVQIKAPRMLVKKEIDRLVYDLQADPESKSSTLLEIMRKVPFLSLNGSGEILLKGSNSYRILLNGKANSLMERNPQEMLRSIPASTILRIEVITTPSARYEAEGLAGLINIVTNKRVSDGFQGTANGFWRFPVGGPGVGTSFALKTGKFAFSSYAGTSQYNTPNYDTDLKRNSPAQEMQLLQKIQRNSDSHSGYLGTELSFDLDTLNLLSGQFNLNGNGGRNQVTQNSSLLEKSLPQQAYSLLNFGRVQGQGLDAAVNFQHSFKRNKAELLTLSYRFMRNENNNANEVAFTERLNYREPNFVQKNEDYFAENSVQLDWVKPLAKGNMELGAKAILRDNGSDFSFSSFDSLRGAFVLDPALGNVYQYRQNVYSIYNSYQLGGKNWGLMAGWRAEQTFTFATFQSNETQADQTFFHLIPSLNFNYTLSEGQSLSLGFVQRIRRPHIVRINPFVDRSNPNVLRFGNPDLQPTVFSNVQLGYGLNKKVSFNLGLGYDFFNKLDLRTYIFDAQNNVTQVTYANVGRGSHISFDFNLNVPISKSLNYSINGHLGQFFLKGDTEQGQFKNYVFNYFTDHSFSWDLQKGWRSNFGFNLISRNPSDLQGSTNGFVGTHLSLNKQALKDKMQISASVNNPFSRFRRNITEILGAGFEEQTTIHEYFRSVNFSVNYRFGKNQAEVKQTRRSIRNDDVNTRRE